MFLSRVLLVLHKYRILGFLHGTVDQSDSDSNSFSRCLNGCIFAFSERACMNIEVRDMQK